MRNSQHDLAHFAGYKREMHFGSPNVNIGTKDCLPTGGTAIVISVRSICLLIEYDNNRNNHSTQHHDKRGTRTLAPV